MKVPALAALLALCLLSAAPAAQEQRRPVSHDAKQLRHALASALKGEFEIVRDELTRRSTYHGAAAFWLVHVRPRRAGHFSLKYTYEYDDAFGKSDERHTRVERTILIPVGPRGCWRRPQHLASYYLPCLGDTIILPVHLDAYKQTYAGHAFVFTVNSLDEPSGSAKGPEPWELSLQREDDAVLSTEEVPNPVAEHLRYLGSRTHISPHRALGYTSTSYATFEAVKPGRFNINVSASRPGAAPAADARPSAAALGRDASVPVIVVPRGAPVTWLAAQDSVSSYKGRFSSHWGDNYLTTPVVMQPGERLTLPFGRYSVRGRDPEADVKRPPPPSVPLIQRLPFNVEREDSYNEWIVDHLPR